MGSLTCATVLLLDMHARKGEVGSNESAQAFTRKNLKSLYLPRPGVESSLGAEWNASCLDHKPHDPC